MVYYMELVHFLAITLQTLDLFEPKRGYRSKCVEDKAITSEVVEII